MAKVFISYKRNVEPDHPFARELYRRLSQNHQAFLDEERILVGEHWAERIKNEIEAADYLVLLISKHSIESGMVVEEIKIAEAARKRNGKPAVLPVRVAYDGALPYDVGALINPLQYLMWSSEANSSNVIDKIERAIQGDTSHLLVVDPKQSLTPISDEIPLPSANPKAPLEAPEGTMAANSPYYIRRVADNVVQTELNRLGGYTLAIRGPRQIGKSSLLAAINARARQEGKAIAFIDFQNFGNINSIESERFYQQFAFMAEDILGLDSQLEQHWNVPAPLSAVQKCTRFFERRILKDCGEKGMVLAIDEADRLLGTPISSDFFGMLRSWHNNRQNNPKWQGLSLVLVISSEPAMLIDDVKQSPFNVATSVELEDFPETAIHAMNDVHGKPISEAQVKMLYQLLQGHPYLSRRAFYRLCQHQYTFDQLMQEATSETGPFGDHLRALLSRVNRRDGLLSELKTVLKAGRCDDANRDRLIKGGLVMERGGRLHMRNALYDQYFRRVLID